MFLRIILVLLLVKLCLNSFSQSLDSLPVLKQIYASFENRFQVFLGEQRREELPQLIYTSKATIENSTENEIVIFGKESAVYYVSMGKGLSLKEAKQKVEEWKFIISALAKGYSTKNDNIGPTLSKDHIGYQYTKEAGILRSYMIDLYYIKMKADGKYIVGL